MSTHRLMWAALTVAFAASCCVVGCKNAETVGTGFANPVTRQDVGPIVECYAGQTQGTSGETTLVFRGGRTDEVMRTGGAVYDDWEAQVYRGKVTTVGDPKGGSHLNVEFGTIYISSNATVLAPKGKGGPNAANSAMVAEPVPVVLKKGTVEAGSVGTHWIFICDTDLASPQRTFVILLEPPGGGAVGRVEIIDRLPGGEISKALTEKNTYLELRGHHLEEATVPQALSSNDKLNARVNLALERANWKKGLRTP